MKTLTRAERAALTAAVLYPEQPARMLSVAEVAQMTNRNPRVIKHFIRKGVLPATIDSKGHYAIQAAHIAIVLFQPAWGERRTLNRRKRLAATVVPQEPQPLDIG